ncbi:MAG: apolipoprotein N-acyltransferase [Candidatus Tokpelaia sp.]|nr:MAG: apolipoprotein N-acyltransferase [Candidatus Tokpelaia sp.]KAA6207337.1 MAG: apolipoprotein N-acyltransferase [Candidatus Tokpelaia sp.]
MLKSSSGFLPQAALCGFYRQLARLKGARRQGAAFLLGALAAAALPPFYLIPLCFISFSAFVLLLDTLASKAPGQPGRSWRILRLAAATGWFFGFGYFTAGLWWLANAMTVDMRQFGWAIPFAIFGLPAFLACYYALAGFLAMLFWRRGLARIAVLSLAFALAEYWRGLLFTGFPWNAIGYSAMPCPVLMQLDALIGLNGMNALAVFIYSLPALAFTASPFNKSGGARLGLSLCLALIIADTGFGVWRLAGASTSSNIMSLRLRLVQPAIPQEEKQDAAGRAANFAKLLSLSRAAPKNGGKRPDLIIWPETAVPYLLDYNQAALARIGRNLQPGQLLLAGAVRVEEQELTKPAAANKDSAEPGTIAAASNNTENSDKPAGRYRFYNSMLLIDSSGRIIAHADKVHLVPFGEYLPLPRLARYFNLQALAAAAGPYSAADTRQSISLPDNISILPLICYEAIFPQESRLKGNKKAEFIVNITNDAWFGNTPGPRQHLAQARLRAVEQKKPLIRVANSGISAYIDAYGREHAALPLGRSDFLDIDVPLPKPAKH